MKRGRENEERVSFESIDMTKCLMLLSQVLETKPKLEHLVDDVFECKTCHRRFSSFQALGGHRASHKKPRLMGDQKLGNDSKFLSLATQPKVHECAICGKEFAVGQALGGHMRKHRALINEKFSPFPVVSKVPVLSRSNSKRILNSDLDLNLTPLENDLQALLGKMAPKVDLRF
ncbi:zinc finger protein ZAT11-like [Durio zibethinus]|uniref:Zinc finger protein ZAT11-like n=1 Tax=Durio zibethinus TaxID=66656 RepID=A0A6P5YTK8_DURZI|nr:zinc finger protein ZAT11-like [Durio zibethinus]